MVKPGPHGRGGDDIDHQSAKHLLDSIGGIIEKQAKEDAKIYQKVLKGNLAEAQFRTREGYEISRSDPCQLNYEFDTSVTSTVTYPCEGRADLRFYDESRSQCTRNRIKDSKNDTVGACAPYRRLHVCDRNLELIKPKKITTHNLLADVCLAAKYEGDSISPYHDRYRINNPDSKICTVLARSFADIGDIIRGKDLYLGNQEEKVKLEKRLIEIFKNITKNNYSTLKDLSLEQVREYWWALNRQQVWKAITCKTDIPDTYFRKKDSEGNDCFVEKCKCANTDPPTKLDYVPQYLRWFEEWTEEFCRKRKKKLQDAKKYCRGMGEDGKKRYCDRNGYDCKQTIFAQKKLFPDSDCKKCSVACIPFVKWIDNQKDEFEKQKKKYAEEINGNNQISKDTSHGKINNMYVDDFYKKLKDHYPTVNEFLELLSKENICKNNHEVGDGKKTSINFKDDDLDDIFSHTEYCKACPWCGMICKNDGTCTENADNSCSKKITDKEYPETNTTTIPVLTPEETKSGILDKYKKFCDNANDNNSDQINNWECHYEDYNNDDQSDDSDNCILGKWKEFKKDKTFRSYHSFFYSWVDQMLKESIEWRAQLNSCINNEKSAKCIRSCKKNCECYKRWVKEKEKEWEQIKKHFVKQKNLNDFDPYELLEEVLELQDVFEGISEAYGDAQAIEGIKKTLHSKENQQTAATDTKNKTILDYLLHHEKEDADKCVTNNPDNDCKKPPKKKQESPARSDKPREDRSQPPAQEDGAHDSSEDEEDGDEVEEEEEEVLPEEDTEVAGPKEGPPTDDVNVCKTVEEALEGDLSEACKLKYGPKAPTGWKCVPTSGDKTTTSDGSESDGHTRQRRDAEGATGKSDASGATCIPPRRRKLYVTPLTTWASGNTQESKVPLDSTPATLSQAPNGDPLLTAFVESAAVETFFLWHKFKKEWDLQKNKAQNGELFAFLGGSQASDMKALQVGASAIPTQLSGIPGVPGQAQLPSQRGPFSPGPLLPLNGAATSSPQQLQLLNGTLENSDEQTPENQLASGTIPTDFLRLMFYTLADYKDILEGKNDILIGKTGTGSAKDEMADKESKIKEAIKKFFQNGDSQPPSGKPVTQNSVKDPKDWWKEHGEHIWKGMICALTYEENGARSTEGTNNIEKNNDVYKKFFGTQNGSPLPQPLKPGTNTGTYQSTYKYDIVKLKEEDSDTEAKPTIQNPTSGEKTTLDSFIKRPPYFRYLEEWGETFCRERKKRLEEIYKECKVDDIDYKCSGYGEDCKNNLREKYDTVPSLECPGCGKYCGLYKRWIRRKKDEFVEQQNAYTEQQNKFQSKSDKADSDNGVCGTVKMCDTAAAFLERLKIRSCKNDNDSGGHKTGDDYIKFDDRSKDKTFGHENYCDPCLKFTVHCKNGKCDNDKGGDCNGKNSIDATDIGNRGRSTEILDMLVSDNSKSAFENGLEACRGTNIFKGIRKEQWKCGKVCGYNVCKPEKENGEKGNDKHIITIRALVTHWVHNFLEDYKKIKHKISHCKENDEKNICKKDCKDKCTCVDKWIKLKQQEWEKIKERFNEQYKNADSDNSFPVRSVLETFLLQIGAANYQNKVIKLSKFDQSCGCSAGAHKQKDSNQDAIECMIKKLQEKIEEFEKKHDPSGKECNETLAQTPDETFDDDIETEEAKKMVPTICNDVIKPEAETDDNCGKLHEEEKEEEKDKADQAPSVPEEEAVEEAEEEKGPQAPEVAPETPAQPERKKEKKPKPPRVKPKPQNPWEHPIVIPSLATSTLIWTVGIGFAAFTYFFLKKKTKSSVGNLFQILQIPKSDYDIPTLKSSNRYIPYASDRYKGKTYIYMEGDSSGDEKYPFMSDTTDVTSSESEYEELDINDIYVPGSPKYKTLIEVVLEPSKRDIQSDDIPHSNKFTDEEWNKLKHDFISNMLQSQPNDVPNNYTTGNVTLNTQPNTLYFDNNQEKPFITSIHDRNLYSGEEYNYNVNMVNNDIPMSGKNDVYSGIDLINDSLNNNNVDIYDEVLKRKENELFGTNHPKHTNTQNVTKSSNSDPIDNQLDLFHTWLDRHRDMCEQWNNKEEVLDKLKEEWNKENNSGDIPSDSNKTLNTDVSIQIHMDNPKPINEFTNMDTILEDLEKYNEPYYDVQDDIYYDVNDHDVSTLDSNPMDVPSKVQIEMDVNTKLVKEKYPIADVWDI
ncbi:erythrocyte membrane protein 1, PfEMP1, putative [Plasmodium sp.]|nr:erythrocyte membrane protein 1, PfEMP1, putative [Plasmodium sp.]